MLPIGGLKEKLLAALRAGIKTVIIPKENEKDLADIPDNAKRAMEILPVNLVEEVLHTALVTPPRKRDWKEESEVEAAPGVAEESERGSLVTH